MRHDTADYANYKAYCVEKQLSFAAVRSRGGGFPMQRGEGLPLVAGAGGCCWAQGRFFFAAV